MGYRGGQARGQCAPCGALFPALVACVLIPWASPAAAQPAGGNVVAGSATITAPSLRSTLITQSSAKAIIDWQKFSLANGQSVQFAQPDVSSITLNRVTGGGLSVINGNITANGQVWLINPNGVMFGAGASVNVGGLLATTSDIANGDFLSGNYAFSGAPAGSAVVNKGAITAAPGGSVVLSAPRVVNKGVITAHAGHVALGSATAFTVDFDGDHLLSYQVNAPATGDAAAADGTVAMTERAAHQIKRGVVNGTGMTEATHARVENGEVILDGGDGVATSGTVDVSGTNAGQVGGTVELQGNTVTVADGAKIDASGDAGGGTVLIGGNFHGAGPQMNSQTTTVGKAQINADAVSSGNGGTVAIYSTGTTKVAAAISAKGGAKSGNGGQVETSGHTLSVADSTTVDTSAANGVAGNWLLDPGTINIVSSGGTTALDSGNNLTLADDSNTTDNINASTIMAGLTSGNVTLEATTAINANTALSYNSGYSLILLSKGSITIGNGGIQNSGAGSIVLVAGWDGSSLPTALAATNSYGLSTSGVIQLQGSDASVGSASGAVYLSAYGLSLQDSGGTSYAQVGYHGAGGGDIYIQTLSGTSSATTYGVSLNEDYGGVTQIGNGGYDGTISGAATGNISITTTGTTSLSTSPGCCVTSTAKIGNYAGGNGELGSVSLTTGTLISSGTTYDANTFITDNIGTGASSGGNVSLTLTAASSAATITALASYNTPHNVTLSTNNAFTVASVSNAGTGNLSLTSASALSISGNLHLNGNLSAASTGGDVILSGVLTIGGTTAVSSGTGAVSVTNTGNILTGAVSAAAFGGTFGGTNRIAINNSQALTLAGVQVTNGGAGQDYGAIQITAATGDITLMGNVAGGTITMTASGGSIIGTAGTITSHRNGADTSSGSVALTAHTDITLTGNNVIEQAASSTTVLAPGQLVFSAGGNATFTLMDNDLALYGGGATGFVNISLGGSYSLSGNATNPNLAFANPVSAGTAMTLTALGSISQPVGHGEAISATTLTASSNGGGTISLIDSGNAVTGAVLLNTSLGNASFTNSVATTLGVPVADDSDPGLYNFVINGNLTVNVANANASEPSLTLDGRLHVKGTGDTTLHANGDLINSNGDGTIYADRLNLISDSGNIGTGWSFGDGSQSGGTLNLFISTNASTGSAAINPGDVNFGGTAMATASGFAVQTSDLLVFGNGLVSQDQATASGILKVGTGDLDIHALGDVTLDNPANAVTGTAYFRTPGNITFWNSLPTTIGRANGGGLDANNNPVTATSVTIHVDGANAPGLTLANSADTSGGGVTVSTSIDASGAVTLFADGAITDQYYNVASAVAAGHVSGTDLTVTSQTLGDISLANPANTISGLIQLSGQGAVTLGNSTSALLGTSSAGGVLTITSVADITIDTSAMLTSNASGDGAIVLAAGGHFTNSPGTGALDMTGANSGFQIYSSDPTGDSFNGLDSAHSAVWNTNYATGINTADNSGNRYAFASQPTLTITSTNVSKAHAGDDVTATVAAAYTVSGLQGVSGAFQDSYSGTITVTSPGSTPNSDPGGTTYPISVSSTSLSLPTGYNVSTVNTGVLTLATLPDLTYVADPFTRAYGSANPTFTGTVTGFQNGDTQQSATTGTLTFTSSATASTGIGSYAILGSGLSATNYQFVQASTNATALTINAALLSYVASAGSRAYGASNPFLTGTVTGFVNNENLATATTGSLAFNSSATATDGVGSYAVTGFGLSAANYTFAQAAGNATALTINPATLSYVANAASRTYGAANPVFTGTVTGFQNGETLASATTGTLTFSSTATTATGIGSYAITGSGLSAQNYVFVQSHGSGGLIINQATLNYVADPLSKTYGSANPLLTGTVTGFVNGDTLASATTGTLSFNTSASVTSGVGTYAVNGNGLSASNYLFAQAAGNSVALTINPATLSYVANTASRGYGAANPVFTGTVTGFQNGDTQASATSGTLLFGSSAAVTSGVGSYGILGSGLSATNYVFAQAAANNTALTITPATLTYVPAIASRSYGAANPVFTGAVTGFVNGDTQASAATGTLTFTSSATATSSVGSYAITGSGLSAANYTFTQAVTNLPALAITPAQLTAALTGSVSKTFDGTTTATLTSANYAPLAGVVNGDAVTLSSLPTTGAYDSAAAGTGKVVTVTGLSLAGAGASNYVLVSSAVSAPIGVILQAVNTAQVVSASNPALLSVTVTLPQVVPALQSFITAASAIVPNTNVSPSTPVQAPAIQIATVTASSPIEILIASSPGNPGSAAPATPADTATNYVIDSVNGTSTSSTHPTVVIIPGLLHAAGGPPPPPPGTGENLSAWGNSSLWQ